MTIVIMIVECVSMVLSLIISVVALIKSYKQTELSNKQNLFKECINNFVMVNGLLELYKENKRFIEEEKKDEIYFFAEFLLTNLINNSYLEKMGEVINKPLHDPEQKVFLSKIEELRNEALKIKFIYTGEESKCLRLFVESYANLLMSLYQYVVLIDTMRRLQENPMKEKDIHEIADSIDEKKQREELFDKKNKLAATYDRIEKEDIINKIEKQIKL